MGTALVLQDNLESRFLLDSRRKFWSSDWVSFSDTIDKTNKFHSDPSPGWLALRKSHVLEAFNCQSIIVFLVWDNVCERDTHGENSIHCRVIFTYSVFSITTFFSLRTLILSYDIIKNLDFIGFFFQHINHTFYFKSTAQPHKKKMWRHNYPMMYRTATSKEEWNSGSYVSESPKYLVIHRVTYASIIIVSYLV